MTSRYVMDAYDAALEEILRTGVTRTNKRTGIKTKSIFGMQCRYRLDERFPILTRRKVWPRSIWAELLWFLSGSTNNKDLQTLGANIWTPWVSKDFEEKHGYVEGSFGKIYGYQLRHFGGEYGDGSKPTGGFDQLLYLVDRIKEDPSCRRILFSLWNPSQLDEMRLAPCHYTYQVFINDEGGMSGMLTQRSGDWLPGIPANVQVYSALTMMLAQQTGYKPYEFIHSVADAHIYEDQFGAAEEYLATPIVDSPRLVIKKAKDILSYQLDDFILTDYNPGPKIEVPIAI